MTRSAILVVAAMVMAVALVTAATAGAAGAIAPAWKNCTRVNQTYPHGVGRVGARDRTTGAPPVTTFRRSNKLYALAMSNNKGLDRDKDGVACERA